MKRRNYLSVFCGLSIGLSGCLAITGEQDQTESPQEDQDGCQSQYMHVRQTYQVRKVPTNGFNLWLSPTEVALGGNITVRLENISGEEKQTGSKHKFDIQRKEEEEWSSIYWMGERDYWTDELITHSPSTGFHWNLTINRDSLSTTDTRPKYMVCRPLELGRYRFVYWGVPQTNDGDKLAIGKEFSVISPDSG